MNSPKERPLLVSPPLVKAYLEGRKTQTRRIVNPQPVDHDFGPGGINPAFVEPQTLECFIAVGVHAVNSNGLDLLRKPYALPGERLWVKEPYYLDCIHDEWPASEVAKDCGDIADLSIWYSDSPEITGTSACRGRYRHGRFMPRWACRLTLDVLAVRLEQLQDISEDDAQAEGFDWHDESPPNCPDCKGHGVVHVPPNSSRDCHLCCTNKGRFQATWQLLHGPKSWNDNPWVWVITTDRKKP